MTLPVQENSRVRVMSRVFIVTLIVAFALALRINQGLNRDLWEDEVISAAHSQQDFWRLPVEVMRDDVHPFLYYLQLRVWAMFGDSDLWLRLNSEFWNGAAIASMFVVARRLYGAAAGWMAALLYAFSAPMVWMAQEVRPYSWLACLLIWAFYAAENTFGRGDRRRTMRGAVFGLCLAIIYTHAVGAFAVFLLGCYSAGRIVQTGAVRQAGGDWLAIYGASAILAIPPIILDLARGANLDAGRGVPDDVATWFGELLLPRSPVPVLSWLSGSLFLGLLAWSLRVRTSRQVALAFIVLPIALAAFLDAVHKPIFKLNIFSTIITPFLVISVAIWLAACPRQRGVRSVAALACIFAGCSMLFLLDRAPTTGFREAAKIITASSHTGDVVYVPQRSMFWGMARYMGAPRTGWQMEVAPALSPPWRRVYAHLGSSIVDKLGLEPRTQTLTVDHGLDLVVGNESVAQVANRKRIWLVTYARADLPAGFPPAMIGARAPVLTWSTGFLCVTLYQ